MAGQARNDRQGNGVRSDIPDSIRDPCLGHLNHGSGAANFLTINWSI